jgi:hypothetical protein
VDSTHGGQGALLQGAVGGDRGLVLGVNAPEPGHLSLRLLQCRLEQVGLLLFALRGGLQLQPRAPVLFVLVRQLQENQKVSGFFLKKIAHTQKKPKKKPKKKKPKQNTKNTKNKKNLKTIPPLRPTLVRRA